MRRILLLFILFSLSFFNNFANAYTLPQLEFGGKKFNLFYSAKNHEIGTYMNEYFKPSETYATWSELVVVHHFPNAYSPIEQAMLMRDVLGEANCPSAILLNEEENTAILDFILMSDKKLPIVLEFNVFKYEKHPICGTSAIQYSKRFLIKNALEVESVKKDLEKSRAKYLKRIKNLDIPELFNRDVDNGIILNSEAILSKTIENLE